MTVQDLREKINHWLDCLEVRCKEDGEPLINCHIYEQSDSKGQWAEELTVSAEFMQPDYVVDLEREEMGDEDLF